MEFNCLREKLIIERDLDIALLDEAKLDRVLGIRVCSTGCSSDEEYAEYLDKHPEEYRSLLLDLLKPAENFFSDHSLISLFNDQLLPLLLAKKRPGDRIRIWIPQCGIGYIAYDVAMLIWKLFPWSICEYDIRVLATDTDEEKIEKARFQAYPEDQFSELSAKGWPLDPAANGLKLSRDVRKIVVFGNHDVVHQAPYSHIDLVFSVGFLPLLEKSQRIRVQSKLVYALATNGILALGRGEILNLKLEESIENRPFSVFTKQVPHTFELAEMETPVHLQATRKSLFDKVHAPTILMDEFGSIIYCNPAAERELGMEADSVNRNILDWSPKELFVIIEKSSREALMLEKIVCADCGDGWIAALAPLSRTPGMERMTATVALRSDSDSVRLSNPSMSACDVATQLVELISDMWHYDTEVSQLRKQAAVITEGLYSRTEELNRLSEEVETRNVELQIANDELKILIIERENATRELRLAFDREHRIAETLQETLLTPIQEKLDGLTIAVKYRAAYEEADVGGDFYQGVWLPKNRFALALGDVSGKGLDAAMCASMTKYMMLGFLSETPDPSGMLSRLNDALVLYGTERFVTLCYLLLDVKAHDVYYGSAGHEPPILYSAATGETSLLYPTGSILGVEAKNIYGVRKISLIPGDMILLYTDGLSEAGSRMQPLGQDGISRILRKHTSEEPSTILDIIYDTATEMSGGKLSDDAASILIKREDDFSRISGSSQLFG